MPADVIEIQLGHLCNDRCVFCSSGRMTSRGEARLLDPEPMRARMTGARRAGTRRVVFVGGEPTIHPYFMDLVAHAVALDFPEIVVFSNGSMPGRTDLPDRVHALSPRIEWRFSFQGGDEATHERVTRRKGSFAQLHRAAERVRDLGHRITVNVCVVETNRASLGKYPALLAPLGVSQVHADMFYPRDTLIPTEEELLSLLPRYTDLAAPLRAFVGGFPAGVDVAIGNLPYCIAPDLAPWIRHGGDPTETDAVDQQGLVMLRRAKYEIRRLDKVKPERCRACVLDGRCTGVFVEYAAHHGTDALSPISAEELAGHDPRGRLLSWWGPVRLAPVLPVDVTFARTRDELLEVRVPSAGVHLTLEGPSERCTAATRRFGLLRWTGDPALVRDVWHRIETFDGARWPLASPLQAAVGPRAERVLRALRGAALGWDDVRWTATEADSGRGVWTLHLTSASGGARLWFAERPGAGGDGYALHGDVGPDGPIAEAVRDFARALERVPAGTTDDRARASTSATP